MSAAEVLEQHYDLLDDVERQKQEAEDMLENGIRQQQVLCVMSTSSPPTASLTLH